MPLGSLLAAIPFTQRIPEAATATIGGTDTQERKAATAFARAATFWNGSNQGRATTLTIRGTATALPVVVLCWLRSRSLCEFRHQQRQGRSIYAAWFSLALIPFTPWVQAPPRQGRSIFAAWFFVGCDPFPSVGSDTTKARPFPSMEQPTSRQHQGQPSGQRQPSCRSVLRWL